MPNECQTIENETENAFCRIELLTLLPQHGCIAPQQTGGETDACFARLCSEDAGLWPDHGRNLYRLPDAPSLLQTFIWQANDLFPKIPELKKFLEFWSRSLKAVHSVRVAHCRLIKPAEFNTRSGELLLH